MSLRLTVYSQEIPSHNNILPKFISLKADVNNDKRAMNIGNNEHVR